MANILRIIANRPVRAGMRKISTSTIFSLSTETTSSHDSDYASDDAYVEICEMMKSPETLIWLGFNEVIARDLWANYLQWYDDDPTDFLELSTGYIKHHKLDATFLTERLWGNFLHPISRHCPRNPERYARMLFLPRFNNWD
jgi:hypothetical protein